MQVKDILIAKNSILYSLKKIYLSTVKWLLLKKIHTTTQGWSLECCSNLLTV